MDVMAIDSRFYSANVRSEPRFGDNIIGALNQADPVAIAGPRQGDRWIPCRVSIKGNKVDAFVSDRVLRKSVSLPRERLMRACVAEYVRFDRGNGEEHKAPYHKYVGEYWEALGINLDGTDRDTAWSAAFISFCVRAAGGYTGFKHSATHSKYAHQSIRRKLERDKGPFWGFKISDHKPHLGDIICRARIGKRIKYDYASQNSFYLSHCDIVTRVTEKHVSTLGGNVSHSVTRTNYPLNSKGFINGVKTNVYAVMRNNR